MITIDKRALRDDLNEVATRFVNRSAPGLPPISWTYRDDGTLSGHFVEAGYDDPDRVARQWADALGLAEVEEDNVVRVFAGSNGGMKVEVWYISDRDLFERKS